MVHPPWELTSELEKAKGQLGPCLGKSYSNHPAPQEQADLAICFGLQWQLISGA